MQTNQNESFLRVWQITGDAKKGITPILPIGRSTFLAGVRSGKYPKPLKLGEKTTVWRKSDIQKLVDQLSATPLEAKGGA